MGHFEGCEHGGKLTWNEEYVWSMFLCVMSRNEFDVESCMNFGMMSGCMFQFVLRHIKMNV